MKDESLTSPCALLWLFSLTLKHAASSNLGILKDDRLATSNQDKDNQRIFCKTNRRILIMSDKIIGMRVGECLLAGGPPFTAAEPEVIIGELDGPFGTAFATLLGDQVKGHTRVLSLMNTDMMVKPATIMVSKVTVKDTAYTNILMGTVQGAISNGVLDAVRNGTIPKEKANDLGIIVSVWLSPGVEKVEDLDHEALFNIHREATRKAIEKAMNNEPSIDYLLENQEKLVHKYYQRALDAKK